MGYTPKFAKKKRSSRIWILASAMVLASAGFLWASQGRETVVLPAVTVPEVTRETKLQVEISAYTLLETGGQAEIRNVKEAVLMLEGEPLLCVTDPKKVDALEEMFVSAQNLGYEPQTYVLGVELLLIREDGMAVAAELGLLEDICRINGQFYDYGPGMTGEASVNGMEKLYPLLDLTEWTLETLTKWPQEVNERYDYILNSYLNDPRPVNTHFRARELRPGKDSLVIRTAEGREILVEEGYLDILRPLHFSQMDLAVTPSGEVDFLYQIIITYGNGDGTRVLYYQGENTYLVCIDWGEGPKYRSLISPEVAAAAERILATEGM